MRGVIVAGTDTGVGKTVLSALLLCLFPESVYWKPIQSGTEEETDSEAVARLSGCGKERFLPERYRLSRPLSPHLSARLDGMEISRSELALPQTDAFLIVETAGGVLVPLREDLLQIDMMKEWDLPVLVAARSTLGTINHTTLTLEALIARNINVAGIISIGPVNHDNEQAIEQFGKTCVLGRIKPMQQVDQPSLLSAFEPIVDFSKWL